MHDSAYLEKRGVPSSTVVTTAFLTHAHLAAKNLQLDDLPLLVTPHPLNDLTPEQMRELARAAYPIVIHQLTGQAALDKHTRAEFVHPARDKTKRDANSVRVVTPDS